MSTASTASLEFHWLRAGHCEQASHFVAGDGSFQTLQIPSHFGLIRHPNRGVILFDTGYSRHFYDEVRRFPECLYAMVTPVSSNPSNDAKGILAGMGIAADEVTHIIVSHFHADHMAGMKDFPKARFIARREAWDSVRKLGRLWGVRHAFLRGLLPDDFEQRVDLLEGTNFRSYRTSGIDFGKAYDLFGDQSIMLIDLPGHAAGQIGALLARSDQSFDFLVADAVWHEKNLSVGTNPARITGFVVHQNWRTYIATMDAMRRLYRLDGRIRIHACHCGATPKK